MFKVGDKVRIIGNNGIGLTHYFDTGTTGEVTTVSFDGEECEVYDGNMSQTISNSNLELVEESNQSNTHWAEDIYKHEEQDIEHLARCYYCNSDRFTCLSDAKIRPVCESCATLDIEEREEIYKNINCRTNETRIEPSNPNIECPHPEWEGTWINKYNYPIKVNWDRDKYYLDGKYSSDSKDADWSGPEKLGWWQLETKNSQISKTTIPLRRNTNPKCKYIKTPIDTGY